MNKITFGTYNDILYNETSLMPQPLSKYVPNWYKNIKPIENTKSTWDYLKFYKTVKSCPSFIDIYKYGFVILAPMDYLINVNEDSTYNWKTPINFTTENGLPAIQDHADLQLLDHINNKNYKMILKINLPLKVFTPKNYSCYQLPIPYEENNTWEAAFGMLRTDKIHPVNIQIIIKQYGEILIKQGTPLAIYLPYKRNQLELEYVNLNSNDKFRKKDKGTYLKQYGSFKHGVKGYLDDNKS